MINDLKQGKQIVKQVLSQYPETRDNDWLLLFACWHKQGIHIPFEFRDSLITTGFKPESVRRWRQKYQANGQFLGTKRLEKMDEAVEVSEYLKDEPPYPRQEQDESRT